MTFEKRIISVGRKEYEVIHCRGEGQCTCRSCEAAGKYGRHWTDWMYKLSEESEELFCIDCLKEKLINKRENEAYLRGFSDGCEYTTKIEELAAINEELQAQIIDLKTELNGYITDQSIWLARNDYLEKENKELYDSYHKGYAVGYEYGKQDALTADRAEPKKQKRKKKDDNQPVPGQLTIFDVMPELEVTDNVK